MDFNSGQKRQSFFTQITQILKIEFASTGNIS